MNAVYMYARTLTTLTPQCPLHVFTQGSHYWVALHSNHHLTDIQQGFFGAPSYQMGMEGLTLHHSPGSSCDFLLNTV